MKFKIPIICTLLITIISSCIKDETQFREADITNFSLSDSIIANVTYDNNIITVLLYDTAGFSTKKIAPKIEVSEGATVFPASGDTVTVKNYQTSYKVTPENGVGNKQYTIRFVPFIPLNFSFEKWETRGKDPKAYQVLADPLWANANSGIAIVYPENTPFPTRSTTDSYSGKYAALMETVEGYQIFNIKAPIIAGSLYRGKFETILSDLVASAKFGQMHPISYGKPILFSGYYKYKPGKEFQDENKKIIPNKVDECDIYALLFKVTKGRGQDEYLTGYDIHTSDKIVGQAILTDRSAKEEYTRFNIPFIYSEELDYTKNDYKLAIVFSSSRDGAFFRGSIGSRLIVDEIEVKCISIQ